MNRESLIQLTDELYRLTLLFPKEESLRYRLREQANEVLANFVFLLREKENPEPDKNAFTLILHRSLKAFETLDIFLELARRQNWVSLAKIALCKEKYLKARAIMEEIVKEQMAVVPEKFNSVAREATPLLQEESVSRQPEPTIVLKLNDRQKTILGILQEREKAQVWQFKQVFPEISKRTLRRDVEQLYTQGLIRRIGERNNTFYSRSQ